MTVSSDREETLGIAIGCVPSGLFIVTTRQSDSQSDTQSNVKTAAMLASWVQQAAFDPPAVTIAVGKGRPIEALLTSGSPLVVNVLEKGQGKLIGYFSKGFAPDVDPLAGLAIGIAPSGQPYLEEAIAYLDAKVISSFDAGDHLIVLASIATGMKLRDGEPATHTRKNGFKY